jgi:hypothetical protein
MIVCGQWREAQLSRGEAGLYAMPGSCCDVLCWYPENYVLEYEHACSIVSVRVFESGILSYI